ncbi:MAG: hypothetical protein Greene071421_39 [Parcubacteria group bacterium Greene0714_21]|nr:MAG: hypothetical protein Greene041639_437 [Parcubacteria group bacterium Greene0416_39]TSC97931.1 MAG: hypothetical protein Greene101447_229 [Parcubacteria group bacterium Greene1014_47]TSD04553.1 MAG: hypothetical protein Greene071421_39 [Parcubacteria group bacterium Greene0714_21]
MRRPGFFERNEIRLKYFARSSKGRKMDSESINLGSIPSLAALRFSLRSNLSVSVSSGTPSETPTIINNAKKIEVPEES